MTRFFALIVGLVFVASIAYLNTHFFDRFEPDAMLSSDQAEATLTEIAAIFDKVVTMLVTLSLGMFILAGFVVKIIVDQRKRIDWFTALMLAVFVFTQAVSISLGYSARLSVLQFVSDNFSNTQHTQSYLAMQAWFLVGGFGCLITVASFFHLTGSLGTSTPDGNKVNDAEGANLDPLQQPSGLLKVGQSAISKVIPPAVDKSEEEK